MAGAGKTHMIAAIVMAAVSARLRVVVLATRTRLVWQMHERLLAFDVRHGVIAATLPTLRNYSALVQVASVDTLYRRAIARDRMPMPAADLVIFDEAQRTLCFAVTKAHGAALLESFRRHGIAAELLTADDDEVTREQVIGRLESGATMRVATSTSRR